MNKLMFFKYITLSCLLLGISACQQVQAVAEPAVLTETSPEVKLELQQQIQKAIGGPLVRLADNAYLFESQIWIESVVLKDDKGRPLDGRHMDLANLFVLQIDQGQCQLRHNKSGQVFMLTKAKCMAEKQRFPEK
ncbi:hypothetical protein [Rheinheimera soli]|jgi:hypothetical protein|uniref:Uncharacterized protein n=1 Tax=Rheinheimera soli TaxID=443616 RepID=A0ABU1VZZ1_9GAMM|nr:hypothetical protein [Rheinheimera soli]MDR7121135.1 hypothetical protein [Rheinheimera soli]